MKATISELWETGREIISFDNSDTERPTSISDLKKCSNVLVGKRLGSKGPYEVLIEGHGGDLHTYLVSPETVRHPADYSKMYVLEIY